MNEAIVTRVRESFQQQYKGNPLIVRSPGRVNLIGEHTDYNNGFVLPAAIDKAIYVGLGRGEGDLVRLYSNAFGESYEVRLSDVQPTDKGWPNYILGVLAQILKRGDQLGGFNLVLDGDVPIGAGLSSSAAVECATALALDELFGLNLSKKEMVLMGQKAEHEYAGVKSGIMDQFASMFGRKDHLIRLDCRTLEYEYEPLELGGYRILLLNTNVEHSLASSEYNTRRRQCEEGVALVKAHHPEVGSLRDATLEQLDRYVKPKDELVYRRCRYVVLEIRRLLDACADLERGHIAGLGRRMFETHDGLSREYEVSCPELDFLVEAVRGNPDVLGARMMGGGFGGCTINLIREEAIEGLVTDLAPKYKAAMKKELTHYVARIEDGTGIVARQ